MVWETVGSSLPPSKGEPMYSQITQEERYVIAAMGSRRCSIREIARELGRSPSTISREIRRNRKNDGWYRASTAGERTRGRRSRSRRNARFTADDWAIVDHLIRRAMRRAFGRASQRMSRKWAIALRPPRRRRVDETTRSRNRISPRR